MIPAAEGALVAPVRTHRPFPSTVVITIIFGRATQIFRFISISSGRWRLQPGSVTGGWPGRRLAVSRSKHEWRFFEEYFEIFLISGPPFRPETWSEAITVRGDVTYQRIRIDWHAPCFCKVLHRIGLVRWPRSTDQMGFGRKSLCIRIWIASQVLSGRRWRPD
jgi:hypothetical protein